MSAYVVTSVVATDPEQFGKYIKTINGLIDKHGGEYIVRGPVAEIVEGESPTGEKVIVSKFADKEAALGYYADPIYQEGKAHRQGAGSVRAVIIEM